MKWIFSNIFSKNVGSKNGVYKMTVDVGTTAAVQRTEDETPKERDPSWVFKGFVAFCLYRCPVLMNPKDRFAHFSIGGELQGPTSSCRFAKRQKKLDK